MKSSASPVRILIVDDQPDDAYLTERLLRSMGFSPPFVTLDSGARVIERMSVAASEFDLVLLDLHMPEMSGLELLEWLRAEPSCRHLKVVVLTSSDDPADVRKAHDLGADGYVLKSCSPEKCAALLAKILPEPVSIPPPLPR